MSTTTALSRRGPLAAAVLSCLLLGGCEEKKPAPKADDDLLMSAIVAQGGVAKLKRGSSFSAHYVGTRGKVKTKATFQMKAGAVRLKYKNMFKDYPIVKVTAEDQCWTQVEKVVLPCLAEEKAHAARLSQLLEGSWLWPLKERKDREATTVKNVEQGGKSYGGLKIKAGGSEIGTLLLDKESYHVVGLVMQTKIGGKSGELVGLFSKVEKHCGVQMPLKREYTFGGKPYLTEEINGVVCEKVADKVFAKPAQVKTGAFDLKHTAHHDLACTRIKGELTGVVAARAKLAEHLTQKGLYFEQATTLRHFKGPPRGKKAKRFVTDVCLPVEKKAWKRKWKGKFYLYERLGDDFLRTFSSGDFAKNTVDVAKAMLAEAKRMKRKPVGPLMQQLWMDLAKYPADQWISELHLPIYPR